MMRDRGDGGFHGHHLVRILLLRGLHPGLFIPAIALGRFVNQCRQLLGGLFLIWFPSVDRDETCR